MSSTDARAWPILRRYEGEHLRQVALPLGGIGTGTVSLGGRGDLRDWEIVNRPAKGFAPQHSFFALFACPEGGMAVARALEGTLQPPFEGQDGSRVPNHGLPRFRACSFAAAYPFGQVALSDPDVPLAVRLEAFNPLVPADADASGIPVAVLRFVLSNTTDRHVAATVCGSVQNVIGTDGAGGAPKLNRNVVLGEGRDSRLRGVAMRSEGVATSSERWGTMALATTATAGVTQRTAWAGLDWGDALLDFWDDFSADGAVDERDPTGADAPMASLAVAVVIPPGGEQAITFLLAWHFPNRRTWTPGGAQGGAAGGDTGDQAERVGNHYAARYRDAWDVAARTAADLPRLEAATLAFVHAFCDSDLPEAAKEAALFNLSTLRTQTCFRSEDGRFYGWEGCNDHEGSCYGSCTHVWNYEQATAFLFGDLSRRMREVEFAHATRDDGFMSFRVNLPLAHAAAFEGAAADGQMGCLMKLYRDWQLCGDDEFLRALWPRARRALEFCWIPGGWDADRDGVMEGCQHNTMDVEYYGPNPQMGLWYLGALRAAEEMARHLGEGEFAAACRALFERGRAWIDAHLFNGEYYEQRVRPPRDAAIAPGLRVGMGATNLDDPELQLGPGCLVDQLAGQYMAHVCGLGYLVDEEHVRATLRAIMRHNFRTDLHGHFNHLRTFALGDEAALLMCSYPRGGRPRRPFPYFNEVMTGFEYTAAAGMLYEGQRAEGLRCIAAIRARYDGRRRNPFDEAECGHHYARAMASWAAVLALTGFRYSAVTQELWFTAAEGERRDFWSSGDAWGTCRQRPVAGGVEVTLTVLHGELRAERLTLEGRGTAALGGGGRLATGTTRTVLLHGSGEP